MFPTSRLSGPQDGFSVLEAAGYIKSISSGCIAILPLGVKVMQKINTKLRVIAEGIGFSEVALPLLQARDLWEESGRAQRYPGLLCETTVGDTGHYVINPTQEESILDLFRNSSFHSDELPVRLFQISERVRNELRPAHGLIRSRSFVLADFYALSSTDAEMHETAEELHLVFSQMAAWTGLPMQRGLYRPSATGVCTYSYWVPSVTKQCIVPVCDVCGASFRVREPLTSCPNCGGARLQQVLAAEVGDVMVSASSVAGPMKANIPNRGEPVRVAMAGIGVSRLFQLLAENNHDKNGLVWPVRLAPYTVHIVATDTRIKEGCLLRDTLQAEGHEAFLDDRERPVGRKLIDADLLGFPIQVILGNKTLPPKMEAKNRASGRREEVGLEQLLNLLGST